MKVRCYWYCLNSMARGHLGRICISTPRRCPSHISSHLTISKQSIRANKRIINNNTNRHAGGLQNQNKRLEIVNHQRSSHQRSETLNNQRTRNQIKNLWIRCQRYIMKGTLAGVIRLTSRRWQNWTLVEISLCTKKIWYTPMFN